MDSELSVSMFSTYSKSDQLREKFHRKINKIKKLSLFNDSVWMFFKVCFQQLEICKNKYGDVVIDLVLDSLDCLLFVGNECKSSYEKEKFEETAYDVINYCSLLMSFKNSNPLYLGKLFEKWRTLLNSELLTSKFFKKTFDKAESVIPLILDNIYLAGNYETQYKGLTLLITYFKSASEEKLIQILDNIILPSFKRNIKELIENLYSKKFFLCCRKYINIINLELSEEMSVFSEKVISIFINELEVKKIKLGKKKRMPYHNGCPLWVDFNSKSKSVSFECSARTFKIPSDERVRFEIFVDHIESDGISTIFISSKSDPKILPEKYNPVIQSNSMNLKSLKIEYNPQKCANNIIQNIIDFMKNVKVNEIKNINGIKLGFKNFKSFLSHEKPTSENSKLRKNNIFTEVLASETTENHSNCNRKNQNDMLMSPVSTIITGSTTTKQTGPKYTFDANKNFVEMNSLLKNKCFVKLSRCDEENGNNSSSNSSSASTESFKSYKIRNFYKDRKGRKKNSQSSESKKIEQIKNFERINEEIKFLNYRNDDFDNLKLSNKDNKDQQKGNKLPLSMPLPKSNNISDQLIFEKNCNDKEKNMINDNIYIENDNSTKNDKYNDNKNEKMEHIKSINNSNKKRHKKMQSTPSKVQKFDEISSSDITLAKQQERKNFAMKYYDTKNQSLCLVSLVKPLYKNNPENVNNNNNNKENISNVRNTEKNDVALIEDENYLNKAVDEYAKNHGLIGIKTALSQPENYKKFSQTEREVIIKNCDVISKAADRSVQRFFKTDPKEHDVYALNNILKDAPIGSKKRRNHQMSAKKAKKRSFEGDITKSTIKIIDTPKKKIRAQNHLIHESIEDRNHNKHITPKSKKNKSNESKNTVNELTIDENLNDDIDKNVIYEKFFNSLSDKSVHPINDLLQPVEENNLMNISSPDLLRHNENMNLNHCSPIINITSTKEKNMVESKICTNVPLEIRTSQKKSSESSACMNQKHKKVKTNERQSTNFENLNIEKKLFEEFENRMESHSKRIFTEYFKFDLSPLKDNKIQALELFQNAYENLEQFNEIYEHIIELIKTLKTKMKQLTNVTEANVNLIRQGIRILQPMIVSYDQEIAQNKANLAKFNDKFKSYSIHVEQEIWKTFVKDCLQDFCSIIEKNCI
ncbi:putative histone-lysine N-methyltransferase 1 isoform X2 [Condylostylus longicornis]|uniref:putative histone-lysine N-methyltransferase 1 isoform X2 n=1 Tax=Condylostylus longicornis TaxID=2530218 RepID=UPI00244DD21A|nr:putative histone-lysine N-methyltransferase 1 isoform X2 [Condylostylus longicornis]